jgi:hypothetical protein
VQLAPVLRATIIMDQEQLNADILAALPNDPIFTAHQTEPKPRCGSAKSASLLTVFVTILHNQITLYQSPQPVPP